MTPSKKAKSQSYSTGMKMASNKLLAVKELNQKLCSFCATQMPCNLQHKRIKRSIGQHHRMDEKSFDHIPHTQLAGGSLGLMKIPQFLATNREQKVIVSARERCKGRPQKRHKTDLIQAPASDYPAPAEPRLVRVHLLT